MRVRSSWGLLKVWWGATSSTSMPSSKKAMRSATSRAKPISCVTQSRVMPVAVNSHVAAVWSHRRPDGASRAGNPAC